MVGVDDHEIDGADETSGANGRSKGQDGPADHDALGLGDEDTRLRKVDELAEKGRGVERSIVTVAGHDAVTQDDDAVDVRYPGRSNQVFHAEGRNLAGRRPSAPRPGPDPGSVPMARDSAAAMRNKPRDTSNGAADRYCIQVANAYHTASLRRSPAYRPSTDLRRRPSQHRDSPPLTPWEGPVERRCEVLGQTVAACMSAPEWAGRQPTEGRSGTAGRFWLQEETG